MSARKTRPKQGTPVVQGMSQRDIAAALGTSTAWLNRCMRLASIPRAQFEERIGRDDLPIGCGDEGIYRFLAMDETPVPARGRVERAVAIFRSMNHKERDIFLAQIGGAA